MKKSILNLALGIAVAAGCSFNTYAAPSAWETTMRYNCSSGRCEVYARPTQSLTPSSSILAATVTVVLPSHLTAENIKLVQSDYPRSLSDFNARTSWAVTAGTKGSNGYYITIDNNAGGRFEAKNAPVAGKEYLLFSFALTGADISGARLWQRGDNATINGSDYKTTISDEANAEQYNKTSLVASDCDAQVKVMSYPNPVTNQLTVILQEQMGKSQLRITNASGKTITSINTGNSFNKINTQSLASGIYFIEVINQNKTIYTSKFIKD
ncbi:MAG: T9SS type A sorting domain-containing protein [Bacteroidota bacterium]